MVSSSKGSLLSCCVALGLANVARAWVAPVGTGLQQLAPLRQLTSQQQKLHRRGSILPAQTQDDQEEAAIMREAEMIAKKKRSNMYNEKGVPYAPWMVRQVDEEAVNVARELRKYRKRKERLALNDADGVVNILEAATSELSGMGLKAKCLSDTEVELVWGTEDETENRGFVVEKKPVGPGQWQEVANYKTWSPLKSKGALGGAYSYIDTDANEGEFLYRVVSEQGDGSRAITCQVGVTVESQGQQLQTKIIVGLTLALLVGFVLAGFELDPIKG